jgi:hypothetical protein
MEQEAVKKGKDACWPHLELVHDLWLTRSKRPSCTYHLVEE